MYNVENYLEACLESICAQTYKNLEIILVDDGSKDDSGRICERYAMRDKRIVVLHKENGGLSSARNAGIRVARGEYLTFIDSDDYITVDMIEQLHCAIVGSDISVCWDTIDENALQKGIIQDIKKYSSYETLKRIFKEKGLTTSAWGKLFKKDLFNGVYFPEGMIYEDYATIYKILDRAASVAVVESPKYYYRTNPTSITKSTFNKKRMDYFTVSDEIMAFVAEKYPRLKKYVRRRAVRYAISFLKEISASDFEDKETIDRLVRIVRKSVFEYLFSGYAILSKAYGLYIALFPKRALKHFKK